MRLTFDRADENSFDDVPLEDDVENDHWKRSKNESGKNILP